MADGSGEKQGENQGEKEIMFEIVATFRVASQPPEQQVTEMPIAHANLKLKFTTSLGGSSLSLKLELKFKLSLAAINIVEGEITEVVWSQDTPSPPLIWQKTNPFPFFLYKVFPFIIIYNFEPVL